MRAKWVGSIVPLGIGLILTVLVGLGVWQLTRLQARRAEVVVIQARLAQAPAALTGLAAANGVLEYQPVTARGIFDFAQEILQRNRAYGASPGVHVLTPLRLVGSDAAVLVDRGWLPFAQSEPAARAAYQSPTDEITITGIARLSQTRPSPLLPLDPPRSAELSRLDAWYWLDVPQIQQQIPYALLPIYIERDPPPNALALPIAGYEVDLTDGPHLNYAIQWFAFAVTLAIGTWAVWRQQRTTR
jgi:surfeit locus 1 family protein